MHVDPTTDMHGGIVYDLVNEGASIVKEQRISTDELPIRYIRTHFFELLTLHNIL